jgi:CHASE2 domain-containing sensor protein
MTGRRPRETVPIFWPYFARGAAWVGLALLLTGILHILEWGRSYERANLDTIATLVSLGKPSERVSVVLIGEDDYKELFKSKSPLNSDVIEDLIVSISQAGAVVVGVDILTEEWSPEVIARIQENAKIPIVWLRDVVIEDGSVIEERKRGDDKTPWKCRGPSVFHKPSGVVREYDARVGFADGSSALSFTRLIETIHKETIHKQKSTRACQISIEKNGSSERRLVPFPSAPPPHRFKASDVLAGLGNSDWQRNRLMGGQIVLLGGAFEASRDYHATPFEDRAYGVNIQAGIIAADLAHQEIDSAVWWIFLLMDAALGLALVAAGWRFGFRWLLAITAGAVIVVFVGSLLLYQQFHIYLSFVPVLIGVGMHFLVEHLREHWKLRQHAVPLKESHRSPAPRSGSARRRGRRA